MASHQSLFSKEVTPLRLQAHGRGSGRVPWVALVGVLALAGAAGCEDADTVDRVADDDRDDARDDDRDPGNAIGTVETILGRVDGRSGVLVTKCGDPSKCDATPVEPGATVRTGSLLETDALSRARLRMSDGTILAIDTETSLRFDGPRGFRLEAGRLYADVTPAGGEAALPEATFASADARVLVKGTKLSMVADGDETRVVVSRGEVELSTDGGMVRVGAGREGRAASGAKPKVVAAPNLSHVRDWARSLDEPVVDDEGAPRRGIGTLIARRPGESVDRKPRPLELASHDVKVRIRGPVARTEVVEEFYNPTSEVLEGTYEFPVPAGTSITRLALWVGDRVEEGEIVETARAERIFRSIVEDTVKNRDPALLKWESGSTFSMKIFPIPPMASRKVLVEYTEVLDSRYDRHKYVYPLARAGAEPMGKFSIDVDLDVGGPLSEVGTPRWPTDLERTARGAKASYSADKFVPTADFALEYRLAAERPVISTAAYAAKDGHSYFIASLRPELPEAKNPDRRDYVFVVDVSYGVAPDAFQAQVATLAGFLAEMSVQDRFKVLACDVVCRPYSDEFKTPKPKEIDDVVAFFERVGTGGSSNLDGMFAAAAKAVDEETAGAVVAPRIVYVGDGVATSGALRADLLLDRIASHLEPLAGVRVDVVGVGADVDSLLLDEIARRFGGASRYVVSGGDEVRAALEIVAAQYVPALADASIRVEPVKGSRVRLLKDEVYPHSLATVQEGDELVVTGRFAGEGDVEVVLTGRLEGKDYEKRYVASLRPEVGSAANAFVPAIWGRARVDALSLADPIAYKDEIIATSFDTSVMSRYTAFLVLENERMYREFKVTRKIDRDIWDPDATPEMAEGIAMDPTADKERSDSDDDEDPASAADESEPVVEALGAMGTGVGGGGSTSGTGKGYGAKDAAGATATRSTTVPDDSKKAEEAPSTVGGLMGETARGRGPSVDTGAGEEEELGGSDEFDIALEEGDGSEVASATEKSADKADERRASASAGPMKPKPDSTPRAKKPASVLDDIAMDDGLGASGLGGRKAGKGISVASKLKGKSGGSGSVAGEAAPSGAKASSGPMAADRMEAPMEPKPMMDPAKSKKKMMAPAKPSRPYTGDDPLGGIGYGPAPRRPVIREVAVIRPAPKKVESPAVLAKLEEVRSAAAANPGSRKERERLVRALIKFGRYDEAREVAEMWLTDDVGSEKPLEYVGDLTARAGDIARAVRLYDSVAEIDATKVKLHERLAAMHQAKGDAEAACAHLRSAMELSDGAKRKRAVATLAKCEAAPVDKKDRRVRATGDLVVEMTWEGDSDLDLSLVPPRTDRLSVLKPARGVEVVKDARSGSEGKELLRARRYGYGSYLVSVSVAGGALAAPVSGNLLVRSHGTTKKMPFVIAAGETAVDVATVKKKMVKSYYYR